MTTLNWFSRKLTSEQALGRTNYRPTMQMAHLGNVAVLTYILCQDDPREDGPEFVEDRLMS